MEGIPKLVKSKLWRMIPASRLFAHLSLNRYVDRESFQSMSP